MESITKVQALNILYFMGVVDVTGLHDSYGTMIPHYSASFAGFSSSVYGVAGKSIDDLADSLFSLLVVVMFGLG